MVFHLGWHENLQYKLGRRGRSPLLLNLTSLISGCRHCDLRVFFTFFTFIFGGYEQAASKVLVSPLFHSLISSGRPKGILYPSNSLSFFIEIRWLQNFDHFGLTSDSRPVDGRLRWATLSSSRVHEVPSQRIAAVTAVFSCFLEKFDEGKSDR